LPEISSKGTQHEQQGLLKLTSLDSGAAAARENEQGFGGDKHVVPTQTWKTIECREKMRKNIALYFLKYLNFRAKMA